MVKHGLFSLSLIRAETGASYKEHGAPDSRDIYAEVEPEDEFYLQLRSDAPEVVYVDLAVDGTLIQKGHRAHPGQTTTVGVIRADNTEVALRFARAKVAEVGRGAEGTCEYWTGQIEATFYGNPNYRIPPDAPPKPEEPVGTNIPETITASASVAAPIRSTGNPNYQNPPDASPEPDGPVGTNILDKITAPAPVPAPIRSTEYSEPRHTYYLNPNLASSDVGYVPGKSADNLKKGVKSAEGTTALRTHNLNWDRNTKPNKKRRSNEPRKKNPENLGSITLQYCSTIGLIHAGILVKPPNWDLEQLRKKCKQTREERERILSEIKIHKFELKSERINGRGEKVVVKTQMELLDLTESDD